MSASACFESGLLVTSPSLVSASPSRSAITTNETSTATSHAASVRLRMTGASTRETLGGDRHALKLLTVAPLRRPLMVNAFTPTEGLKPDLLHRLKA